jgi:hypothetical protein
MCLSVHDMSTNETTLRQIGRMNVLAISGGRVTVVDENTIRLPVSSGYRVEVEYVPGVDLYTVRRIMVRCAKTWNKGEDTHVYADQLGDTAYRAHAYKSYDFGVVPS